MKFDPEKIMRVVLLRPQKRSDEEKRYGSFNRRMIAATLDLLLISVFIAPLVDYVFVQVYGAPTVALSSLSQPPSTASNTGEAIRQFMQQMRESGYLDRWATNLRWQIYALCVYVTICWHYWNATPGKILCRLQVVDAKTGAHMSDWQSILRLIGYFVSAIPFGLGFLWIGMNKKRRGFHDYLAGTVVISLPIRKTVTSTLESAPPSDSPAPSTAE